MASGSVGYAQGMVADQTQMLQAVVDGLAVYNQSVNPLINDLSFRDVREVMRIAQAPIQFRRSADGGSPESQRQSYRLISVPLEGFESGVMWTIEGLQDAKPGEFQQTFDAVMAGASEREDAEFFRTLFTSQTAGSVGTAYRASWYNGETDVPNYKNNSHFGSAHTHFAGINTTTLALSHVTAAAAHIRHHGYGLGPNSLLAFFNTDAAATIEGLLNISVASSLTTPERIKAQDQGAYGSGIRYAGIEFVFDDNVPSGYFAVVDRSLAPIAKRVHYDPSAQGLKMYQESFNEKYPLAGSYFKDRYGFVVAHLGAGVARQIVATTTYTNPTFRLTN
ncbi:MAG TPA: hypothetical protein VGN26_03935 [Armatimonadota bacterium]|jgi:hypothetical protein